MLCTRLAHFSAEMGSGTRYPLLGHPPKTRPESAGQVQGEIRTKGQAVRADVRTETR